MTYCRESGCASLGLGDCKVGALLLRKDAAMTQKNSDLQRIEELIEVMKKNELVEVEIKHGDDKILLKRAQPQPPGVVSVPVVGSAGQNLAQQPAPEAEVSVAREGEDLVEIKSSIVGTYYTAPSPDSEPFVEVGSQITPQTIVCVIEAMKVMNEIKAEISGTIVEIPVTNGQAVEYGQVLFKVKPD